MEMMRAVEEAACVEPSQLFVTSARKGGTVENTVETMRKQQRYLYMGEVSIESRRKAREARKAGIMTKVMRSFLLSERNAMSSVKKKATM
jgi:2-phospho-L-lactate guanylyltransferase (CobY/MobA/RfbA family)